MKNLENKNTIFKIEPEKYALVKNNKIYTILKKKNYFTSFDELKSKSNKFEKFLEELRGKYPFFDEKIKENTKKFNINEIEALAMFLRNCDDESLLCCEHCIENRTEFISIIDGWALFCSRRCMLNSNVVKLKNLTREEKIETVKIKKEYNFNTFEEARYFIDFNIRKGCCKICSRPTKFINYVSGYRTLCEMCREKNGEPKKNRISPKNPEANRLVKLKVKEHGKETCYDMMINFKLKKLCQSAWHLDKNDDKCIYGCCVHCGKRLKFNSYTIGYNNVCQCRVTKNVNILRRPLSLQKHYERLFLSKLTFCTGIRDIDGNILLEKRNLKKLGSFIGIEEKKARERKRTKMIIERWGQDKLKNPIIYSKMKNSIMEYGANTVRSRLRKNNYDPDVYDLANDPNWWYQIYVVDEMTIDEISYYTGLSKYIIKNRLEKFGITKDSSDETFEEEDEFQELMIPLF